MIKNLSSLFLLGCLVACSASAATQSPYQFSYLIESPDPKSGQGFGEQVQIEGQTVFVGASNWREPGSGRGEPRGAVFENRLSDGSNIQHTRSPVQGTYTRFGAELSVSENFLLVGASADGSAGSAHLYSRTTGERLFEFANPETVGRQNFGAAVSVTNEFSLIAATAGGGFSPQAEGVAYLFDNKDGELVHTFKTAENSTANFFDANVQLSGDFAYVAEPYSVDSEEGRVSQFNLETGELVRTFYSSRRLSDDARNFGRSFDVEGQIIAISDPGNNVVEFFDVLTGEYIREIENMNNNPTFSGDIDLDGDLMVVGFSAGGTPQLWNYQNGKLLQYLDFPPQPGGVSGLYGTSVSIVGDTIAIGASGNTGADTGDLGGDVLVFKVAAVPLGATAPLTITGLLALSGYGLLRKKPLKPAKIFCNTSFAVHMKKAIKV